MNKIKWIMVLSLVLLALGGCGKVPAPGAPKPPGGITVDLEMAKAPAVDEPVGVTLTVTAEEDAPGTDVWLNLDPTVTVVSGEGKWKLILKPISQSRSPPSSNSPMKDTSMLVALPSATSAL